MSDVSLIDGHVDGANTCVICGRDIPEGSQVCVICGKTKPRDMVEVVRCKDCKYCETLYPIKAIGKEPEALYYCIAVETPIKPTDFCSYGERRGKE